MNSCGRLSAFSFYKQYNPLSQTALVELLVELAFIAAVGGVGFEDVAVAGFQLFQDTAFVDDTGTAVVGEAG